jgi:tetratricopeptide (TPR) repeat protein
VAAQEQEAAAPAVEATPAAPADTGAPAPAVAGTPDLAALEAERVRQYDQFKALVAESRYAEAVPLAREVLRLTEIIDPHHEDLPTAWNNLGVAQLRAADPKAALESFGKALDLVESTQGIGSRRLIGPMAGLGAAYNAMGQPAQAAEQFERAIAVSRRASGLFNLEQLDLMDALIKAYSAVGFTDGIDRERRYALQIVEKRFGYGDPRALPRVTQLAEWYEATGRYAPARLLYKRALDIASRESGGRNPSTINALLAIARTHRLQFAEDPESMIEEQELMPRYAESIGGSPVSRVRAPAPVAAVQSPGQPRVKLDPEGRAALDQALDLLETSSDPPPALMSHALLEQGDWAMTAGSPEEALASYERAWPLLESLATGGATNPLASPRRLLYRAPCGQKRSRLLAGEIIELRGEFRVDVDASGQPVNVEAAGGNLSDMQSSQVQRALQRSVFSPAYVDGKPVATTAYRLSETWFEFEKDYAARSGGAEEASGDAAGTSPSGGDSPAGGGEVSGGDSAAGRGEDSGAAPAGGETPPPDAGEVSVDPAGSAAAGEAAGAGVPPAAEPPPSGS